MHCLGGFHQTECDIDPSAFDPNSAVVASPLVPSTSIRQRCLENDPPAMHGISVNDSAHIPGKLIWSEFLEHFKKIAKSNGTMISRESRSMTRLQFEAMFPGGILRKSLDGAFSTGKINNKHGIFCVKSE